MGTLLTGIIVGLLGGIAGAAGSAQADDRAYQAADDQQKYLENLYGLQKKAAEEQYKEAQRQAEKNAKEAQLQADLTDKGQDITEAGTSFDINNMIDSLYLQQTQDAMQWNAAALQAGSSKGNALANIAGSGIRSGSSLSDAVLMESATNSVQLQFTQDATRRGQENSLASVLNGLAGTKLDIMGNRIGADVTRQNALELVNSYAEGGYNYNLYQNQKKQAEETYNYKNGLLKKEKDEHSGWNKFWNGVQSFLGMGAKGFQTGYNIAGDIYEATKYKTTV